MRFRDSVNVLRLKDYSMQLLDTCSEERALYMSGVRETMNPCRPL
jgi:hypothetical protein